MADLGTILVNAATVNVNNVWAVGTFADIDEGIASADDVDVGDDSNVNGDVEGAYALANMPGDFDSMATININIYYRVTRTQANNRSLFARIVTDDTSPVILANEVTIATNITATTKQLSGVIPMTINGTPTKAQWDNAVVVLRLNIVKNKGGDTNGIRVDTLEFTGTYNPTAGGGDTGLNIKIDGVTYSDITKIDAVAVNDIKSVDRQS